MSVFKKAVRAKKKLRMALCGVSGSGKTFSSLGIASGLGDKICLIDAEHGSATLYADRFDFDHCELPNTDPRAYIDYIRMAEKEGYECIIIDSISHAWNGQEGALALHDKIAMQAGENSYTAWRHVTPLHNALVHAMLSSPAHIIVTMRSEEDHVIEKDPTTGKNVVRSVGLAPIQRKGFKYEFDIMCDINIYNECQVVKTRYSSFHGKVLSRPGKLVGEELAAWLAGGVDVASQGEVVPPVGLPKDLVDEITSLFFLLGYSPQQINASLAKRGVSRIESLTDSQAREMIAAMYSRIEPTFPKPQSVPEPAPPKPEPEPAPEPAAGAEPQTLAEAVDERGGMMAEIGRLAVKAGYTVGSWLQARDATNTDLNKMDDASLAAILSELRVVTETDLCLITNTDPEPLSEPSKKSGKKAAKKD